jgi:hypothetical protein
MNATTCEPSNDFQSAAQLEQLETHLQAHLSGRVRDIRLLLRDNGLVLRGRCQTYYAKQLAQHAVMRAGGFRILANEIEVS